MDMEYVVDFVQMKRFDDPLLVEVLEAMRTPGGMKISEDAWRAITATKIQEDSSRGASQTADPRLRDARNWYECAYEWRLVSYAMHVHGTAASSGLGSLWKHRDEASRTDTAKGTVSLAPP